MSRSRKIAVSLVCLYLILVTWQIFYEIGQNKMLRFDPDHFLYMFFGIQFGGVLDDAFSLYLFEFSLIPVIGSALAVFTKNNNSFSNYQQRSGYHGYLKTACLRAFGTGFGLAVLINIYQMIIISLFYSPFVYQNPSFFLWDNSGGVSLSQNSLVALVLYILMSAIGWGSFSLLILAVGLWIKKNSLYLVSGSIIMLICILTPTLIIANSGSLLILSDMLFLPNIMSPGLLSFVNAHQPVNVYGLYFLTLATLLSKYSILFDPLYRATHHIYF